MEDEKQDSPMSSEGSNDGGFQWPDSNGSFSDDEDLFEPAGGGTGIPDASEAQTAYRRRFQRSHSFGGTSNCGYFGELGGGFNPPTGFQPNFSWQHPGFYQQFGQDYVGGMPNLGQFAPVFSPHAQPWQTWGQQSSPFGTHTTTSPGFVTGISGSQSARGAGEFWPMAGLTTGAGLATTGLTMAYNQGYDMMRQGFPSAQNGEPVRASSSDQRGEGDGKQDRKSSSEDDKDGENSKRVGEVTEQPQAAAVTEQPQAAVAPVTKWFDVPSTYEVPDDIPKGLEILTMVDELVVQQEVENVEAIANAFGINYEGNNSYIVSTRDGSYLFKAEEETNILWRCFCTQLRPVHIKVTDRNGTQVLAYKRHFRCFPCAWFKPCRENVTVFLGPKENKKKIGRVTQSCCGGCCTPMLNIESLEGGDSNKSKRELIVKGPCIITDLCGTRFNVLTVNKIKVGEVQKEATKATSFMSILKEASTDADKFTISFPQDLKVEAKATALMALLLVDLLFFEFGGTINRNLDGSYTFDLCVMFCCGCPLQCRYTCKRSFGKNDEGKGAPVANQIER